MQQLLSDLPKTSFGVPRVKALSNIIKTGIDAWDVGWELRVLNKAKEYAVMLAKFKIWPFLNIVARISDVFENGYWV